MPPEASERSPAFAGRCYCGDVTIRATAAPEVVAYCHCNDCRRRTGAPVTAFAGFSEDAVMLDPASGPPLCAAPGVARGFGPRRGSPLAARLDYLPGQVNVPLGLLDRAAELPPTLQSHAEAARPRLHPGAGAILVAGSARAALRGTDR